MDKELKDFFESKGFEVVEKKTTTQILIENLLAFSVREKKGGLFDISINMVKEEEEKGKLKKRTRGFDIDFEKAPFLHNINIERFKAFCKESKVIPQIKRLSEFREVQSDFTLAEAQKDGKTLKWRSNLPTENIS